MGSPVRPPSTSFSGGNFSHPRQWRRAAFAGQMMLGAAPPWERPFGCSHLILLPSHGGHASTFITERALRTFPAAAAAAPPRIRRRLGPNRHHSIFAARAPVPRPFDLCQRRPKSIADRAGANPFSRASLAFARSSDGWKEGPEGECTTNEAHPEHALPFLLPFLDLTRATTFSPSLSGSDPMHFR